MTQADLERLLDAYVTRHRESGGDYVDPVEFLDPLEGAERETLATLIETYLDQAPRRAFDREAFERSPARRVADAVELSLTGAAGAWPWLLPSLRDRARMPRDELVAKLAAALEHPADTERVAAYYHGMETGALPAGGVSERVLDALGAIVGVSGGLLRRAGEAWAPPPGEPARGAVFARTAFPRAELRVEDADALASEAEMGEAAEPDELDRLFTGG